MYTHFCSYLLAARNTSACLLLAEHPSIVSERALRQRDGPLKVSGSSLNISPVMHGAPTCLAQLGTVCVCARVSLCVYLGSVIFDKMIQGFLPKPMSNQGRLLALWLEVREQSKGYNRIRELGFCSGHSERLVHPA